MDAHSWQIAATMAAMIIAAIIAAIGAALGPVLAVIVKSRIDQPRPTPKTIQPKMESQRANTVPKPGGFWWTRALVSTLVSRP
jgi:hypothetical protein